MRAIHTLWRVAGSDRPREFLVASGVVALAFFLYAARFPAPPYFGGDAEHYWRLGASFFPDGSFSLLGAEPTFRGYLLPLIFGALQALGGGAAFYLFYALNAAFTAVSLVVVLPLLVAALFTGVRPTVWQALLVALLFFVFWRGYLVEPLSDTWSFFFAIGALVLLLRAGEANALAARLLLALLSGAALAAAVNLRPIFLICVPMFALGALSIGAWSFRRAAIVCAAAGAVLVFAPQALINGHFLQSRNPFVHSGNLYTLQLYLGLAIQRLECAYIIDPAGLGILKAAGIEPLAQLPDGDHLFALDVSQRSPQQYAAMVAAHPLEAALVYLRHTVNGMTLLGSNIYACAPAQPRVAFNLASMGLGLLALIAFVVRPPRLVTRAHHMLAWIPLLPVVFSIPAAIEGRFFFPLHAASYAFLAFFALQPAALRTLAHHWRGIMLAFVALLALAALQLSNTWVSTYVYLGAGPDGTRLRPLASPAPPASAAGLKPQ